MRGLMLTLFLCLLSLGTACNQGPWAKDNKKKEVSMSEKLERIKANQAFYCEKAVEKYLAKDRFHECDSALFAGLLSVACDGVDLSAYEAEKTGRMCRDWECSCWDEANNKSNGSDSDYSKDMNAGVQLGLAVKSDKDLIERIVDYLAGNSLVMCEAKDDTTQISKCLMPPGTYSRWQDMLKDASLRIAGESDDAVLGKTGFQAHLAVLGILTEGVVYGAISDISLKELKAQASREEENALYRAAHALYDDGKMEAAADLWLSQCPEGRLPNNHQDYCTDYRYQRDKMKDGKPNKDWLPCPDEKFHEHPGVDCAFAAAIILGG